MLKASSLASVCCQGHLMTVAAGSLCCDEFDSRQPPCDGAPLLPPLPSSPYTHLPLRPCSRSPSSSPSCGRVSCNRGPTSGATSTPIAVAGQSHHTSSTLLHPLKCRLNHKLCSRSSLLDFLMRKFKAKSFSEVFL